MPPDGTKHVQVKLSQEEYDLFAALAKAAGLKPTPYARVIFLDALERERGRLQQKLRDQAEKAAGLLLAAPKRKPAKPA